MPECTIDEHNICRFDEKTCEVMHKSIEARLSVFSWVFGIIISSQIALCTFMGWITSRVSALEIMGSTVSTKLESIDRIQQQVLLKLEKNSDKLDVINETIHKKEVK